MSNALIYEKSPYLLQHADNPVEWMPWGQEAFTRARSENKLIFLSIGYSTCHWCHVMERESFENDEMAAVMNRHFINIKVDREERPDVDQIYMSFVQATTGQGGWPLNVWITPELQPIAGGTYFPPSDRYGRPGFVTVLNRIAGLWRDDGERLRARGAEVVAALRHEAMAQGDGGGLDAAWLDHGFAQFQRMHDLVNGGFGSAPKFPRPVVLDFLFRYAVRRGLHQEQGRAALEMALFTLEKMAAGGMCDHVGGGFHRYSVDARWHVPHFEKMLYDQAQLACSYLEGYQVSGDERHASTAREIFDYVARDLTSPEGAFYSAEDADSKPTSVHEEKLEGAFYVWKEQELAAILEPLEWEEVRRRFDCRVDGNVDDASDPHGELKGANVLMLVDGSGDPAVWQRARTKMIEARHLRPRPHLDDKILTAWNGLMISALARGGVVLDDPVLIERAAQAAAFIQSKMWIDGELRRSYREGVSLVHGFLVDYAFLIRGLIDLYEAGGDGRWLDWAVELQSAQDRLFGSNGAYFSTRQDDPHLIVRMKEDYDGAEPGGNAVAALNLLRLEAMTGLAAYGRRAHEVLAEHATRMRTQGTALPLMLVALDAATTSHAQAVLAGDFTSRKGRNLRQALTRKFKPHRVVMHAVEPRPRALELAVDLLTMKAVDGQPTVYLCENFSCQRPCTEAEKL
jgi:uncharacterized protein